jgi:formylglycine-generating enzyme required for sulfatase activity
VPDGMNVPQLESGGDGGGVTPLTEPQPTLTIDRLLLLETVPGTVGALHVVLRGACIGTQADLYGQQTCVDTENTLVAVTPAALVADRSLGPTLAGTFAPTTPCTATPRSASASGSTPLFDDEVCVQGGAFIFGSEFSTGEGDFSGVPERIAIVDPFLMDRYEVTVGRWRAALTKGFSPAMPPYANAAPIPPSAANDLDESLCTFSSTAGAREAYPLNCVTWAGARELCQFEGGDLPTEVQWEYATAMAGRAAKTPYPWGGDDESLPGCAQFVFGRGDLDGECMPKYHFGPAPVNADGKPGLDWSLVLGIADLGGNLGEWALDALRSLGSNCWMSQPLANPTCDDPSAPTRAVRGATWESYGSEAFYGRRSSGVPSDVITTVGFRCVRTGTETAP